MSFLLDSALLTQHLQAGHACHVHCACKESCTKLIVFFMTPLIQLHAGTKERLAEIVMQSSWSFDGAHLSSETFQLSILQTYPIVKLRKTQKSIAHPRRIDLL